MLTFAMPQSDPVAETIRSDSRTSRVKIELDGSTRSAHDQLTSLGLCSRDRLLVHLARRVIHQWTAPLTQRRFHRDRLRAAVVRGAVRQQRRSHGSPSADSDLALLRNYGWPAIESGLFGRSAA